MPITSLGLASMAAVRQYLRLADSQGVSVAVLLERVGLPKHLAWEDSGHISGEEFQRLLAQLLVEYPSPILGLLSGDYVQPGSYSVLGYITMSCSTLGEAIARIVPFEKLVGDMGITTIHTKGDEVHLQWQGNYPYEHVRTQMVDNVLSSWIGYARWLAGEITATPIRVELERTTPALEYLKEYQTRWGCPVVFEQPHNRIVIESRLLSVPLRQADAELRQTLEQHAQHKLATLQPQNVFLQQIQENIQRLLLDGVVGLPALADTLHVSARTLQRRFKQEGMQYQQLLVQARRARAEYLLQHSVHSIEDIALMLGFEEPTSFYRSFKQWTNSTPSAWRKMVLSAPETGTQEH